MTGRSVADGQTARTKAVRTGCPYKFENEEALAKSYREFEQRFTELAGEKRALEASLSSSDEGLTDEDIDAMSAAVPYAQTIDTNISESEPAQAAQRIEHASSNLDVMRLLTEAAHQAQAQVDARGWVRALGLSRSLIISRLPWRGSSR